MQTIKLPLGDYYKCKDGNYIKSPNVRVDHLTVINQIPISAKCNELLPFKLHKIQIKDPILVEKQNQHIFVEKKDEIESQTQQIIKQPPSIETTNQSPLLYSFSLAEMQNPNQIFQKEEVNSIHIQDKILSRMKADQKLKDLTESTFTNLKKTKEEMKRSLFETHRTNFTDQTWKDSEKLDIIAKQLLKEKAHREEFERKYEVLFNLLNNKNQITASGIADTPFFSEELPKAQYPRKNSEGNHYYVKSSNQSEQQFEEEGPIVANYTRNRRKNSSPSPIVINLGSELLCKCSSNNSSHNTNAQIQSQQLNQIKGTLSKIHQQVTKLSGNLESLERRIEQQQNKRQRQALLQELKEKENRIQQVLRENQKMKEINQNLAKQSEQQKPTLDTFLKLKLQKSNIFTCFIISLLLVLLLVTFRKSVC